MSRIGKKEIKIPEKTEVTFASGILKVKGPKGELTRLVRPDISIDISDGSILLKPLKENNQSRALWGTYASHLKNMIAGVNTPYQKKLILEGVGYKSEVKGNNLVLALGFSHPVNVPIAEDLSVAAEKNLLTISGINKEAVGQFAAQIRALKKPEPYKGKGFRYEGEIIRRKQGKKSV
ncbi:MAG TPA: 50S ribosomal protein L6 [Candidatus Paceibacterota bacterium]